MLQAEVIGITHIDIRSVVFDQRIPVHNREAGKRHIQDTVVVGVEVRIQGRRRAEADEDRVRAVLDVRIEVLDVHVRLRIRCRVVHAGGVTNEHQTVGANAPRRLEGIRLVNEASCCAIAFDGQHVPSSE